MSVEPTTVIVVAVVILTFLGTAYGLKTRKGSGINRHPDKSTQDPVRDPEAEGLDVTRETERPDSTLFDQRGKS